MLNLKELSERYKDVGLGYCHFGGKNYYEVNSDIPISLNSFGGKEGFILNDREVAEYASNELDLISKDSEDDLIDALDDLNYNWID